MHTYEEARVIIKKLTQEEGMYMKDLAAIMGISPGLLSKIKKGTIKSIRLQPAKKLEEIAREKGILFESVFAVDDSLTFHINKKGLFILIRPSDNDLHLQIRITCEDEAEAEFWFERMSKMATEVVAKKL